MFRLSPLFSCLLTVTVLTAPASAQAAIKCWTNKEGVRECGNVIPPEYAQQETRTVNERGITVDVKQRAKTQEELEATRAQREEEERRAAEEKRLKEERFAYDQMLLSTFTNEQDLINSRDRKLSSLDAIVEITTVAIDGLERKLADFKKRAAGLERSGNPIPADLKDDMAGVEKQIADKRLYIVSKKKEKADLTLKYEADLNRYRELKSFRPR